MQVILFFLLVFVGLVFGECVVCDRSCGNWSCITNCREGTTNPTFDVPRCGVDLNGNGMIDDCSELLPCQWNGYKYICQRDIHDPLCQGRDFQGPTLYDTNPSDPDAPIWAFYRTTYQVSYPQYQNLLQSNSVSCASLSEMSAITSFYSLPVWVCGGILYSDAWLSYTDCSYQSFDGAYWKVKNNDCYNANKIWQKLGLKCYWTYWYHTLYLWYNNEWQTFYLYWYVPAPQGSWSGSQTIYVRDARGNYVAHTVYLRCVNSTNVRDELNGQNINLCTAFEQRVSGPLVNYSVYWWMDTSWSCSTSGRSAYSSYSWEYWYASSYGYFYAVIEERPNNRYAYGVAIDRSESRCRPCGRSMNELSGGVVKSTPDPDTYANVDYDKLAQCANPRFFSGEVRTCRPGGLTVLGASCCGISGWTKFMCSRGEKELKKKREAGICTYVGTYCSKRVFGFCLERKRSFCCFNSWLARVLQECGRPQIGKGWGSAKRPDCSGYTIEEFARIDFTDQRCAEGIEQWARTMAQRVGDNLASDVVNRATTSIQNWISNVQNKNQYGGEK